MNRINEIGDTPKGQEALGRTAERAYQRAQRTSGADKKRYEKTFNDAYRTGGKTANKHLGGSREHFDNGRDYEHEKWEKEHNGNVAESKNMNKKIIRLTESDLHKIVKESAKRIMKEVALKGKSGKTYSLHGTDPESWAVMSRVRGKNGYFPNTPQHYHACRDEDNWIELDDKAHPNLRSRNNANRINAMMNRIDDKSKDIMAANESKLSRIVKESVNKILMEVNFGGKSLHGNNPEDWIEVSKARKDKASDALNGDEYYTDDDERAPYLNKNYRASNRDEINAGRICVDKFVKLRPRVYHRNSLYASQANKVFNRGMGSLAFVNFLVDEKVILVNKVLANKRDMELIQTNFPEWKIEFVSLGYPDWYEIKNLKACRGK